MNEEEQMIVDAIQKGKRYSNYGGVLYFENGRISIDLVGRSHDFLDSIIGEEK